MITKCDPEFQKELDRINAEIDFEDELAAASKEMEMYELFDRAETRGEEYSAGYWDGFWASRELLYKYQDARRQSIKQKYDELNKRWGL